jgi:hypothetical protein
MLENSGAELERMVTRQASRKPAPGQAAPRRSGAERGQGRRPGGQRGAERADGKNPNQREGTGRAGEAVYTAPGYRGPGGRPGRRIPGGGESARRGDGTARGGPALRPAGADAGLRPAEGGYHAPGTQRRRWEAGGPDNRSARHGLEPVGYDGDGDYDEDPDEAEDDAAGEDFAEVEYADAEYGEDEYADDEYADDEDNAGDEEYDCEPGEADGEYDDDAVYSGADGGYPAGADGGYRRGAAPGYGGGQRRYRGAGGAYRRGGGGARGAAVVHVFGPPGHGAGIAGAEPGEYGGDGFGPRGYGGDGYGPDRYGSGEYGGDGYGAAGDAGEPDERTEVLINRGRRHARPTGVRRALRHWRAIGVAIAGVAIGSVTLAMVLPGDTATWPPSVAVVEREIAVACENPNVVAEPTQVNFACAKDTRQILWVFSLLTSGDNPSYSDTANGRKGLEPITPAQGGDVAWSLNLHHPYDPANPVDSLEVAARAINNIIGGATVTGSSGAQVVQPGLESTAANCARYTGSSSLVTRQGFPAVCAQPIATPGGQAALVSDVFQQWMVGTPAQVAAEAGVLFENADNPGDPRVQAILKTLPQTGL